ncbi:MAG: glycosyltransferase family 2 protein [Caulobacter sp.]
MLDKTTDPKSPKAPRVSVVIPAYNAAKCIGRAIASLQTQTEQDFEVIVVNDCSKDDTAQVLAALAAEDPRVRVLHHEKNGGPSVARNTGFAAARGDWIAILDADDSYAPHRLETLLEAAERHGLDMVADDIVYYDAVADMEVGIGGLDAGGGEFRRVDFADYLRASMFRPSLSSFGARDILQYALLKFTFRRAFVAEHGLAYPVALRDNEDFFFYAECIIAGARAGVLSRPGYVYTQRVGKVSKQNSGLTQTRVDRLQVVAAVDTLIARHGAALAPRDLRLLRRRRAQALGLRANEAALDKVRRRQIPHALLELAGEPASWGFLAHKVLRRVRSLAASR